MKKQDICACKISTYYTYLSYAEYTESSQQIPDINKQDKSTKVGTN